MMKNVYFFQEGIGTLLRERDIRKERIIYAGFVWGGDASAPEKMERFLNGVKQSLFTAYAHVMCGAIVLLLKTKDNN